MYIHMKNEMNETRERAMSISIYRMVYGKWMREERRGVVS